MVTLGWLHGSWLSWSWGWTILLAQIQADSCGTAEAILTYISLCWSCEDTFVGHGVCTGNSARTYTALLGLVSTDTILHSSSACLLNPELPLHFCTWFWTTTCVRVASAQTANRPSSAYTSDLIKSLQSCDIIRNAEVYKIIINSSMMQIL